MSIPVIHVLGPVGDSEAAEPSTLRIGFMERIDSLNPYSGVSDTSSFFYSLVYDTLTCVDNKLNTSPNLALSTWAVPETDPEMVLNGLPYGSLWQYNLTSNAYWNDGEPFTAEDLVWNINLNADNYVDLWAFQPYAYFMDYAEVIDADTVRILFYDRVSGDPCPAAYGGTISIFMLPSHKLSSFSPADIGFTWTGVFRNESVPIVGTGPFTATISIYNDWVAGETITLVKNPNYHFGPDYGKYVNFDRIQLKFFDDSTAMQLALELGDIDVASFPPQTYLQLESRVAAGLVQDVETFDGPKVTQYWTEIGICQGMSGPNPSRTDPVIRHALAQAVNKTYIADNFYYGMAEVGSTIIAPTCNYWHYEPTDAETWKFDLLAASSLLESNGYVDIDTDGIREATSSSFAVLQGLVPEGTKLSYEMLVRHNHPEEKEIALYLEAIWWMIGIDLTIVVVDESIIPMIVYGYSYDMMIWYWSSDVDPNYQLFVFSTMAVNGWNDIRYSNPAYDENYTHSVNAMDREMRSVYVDNCQKIIYEDCGNIVLAYPYQMYAWRVDTFSGWGDWSADPGRSLDNYWTANPLLFDLMPGGVKRPTDLSLAVDQTPAVMDVMVTFEASALLPVGSESRFTLDFGDGSREVRDTQVTSSRCTETFYHVYSLPDVYTATLWIWDGQAGDEHNASTSVEVVVEPAPRRTVDYLWYDMFNVPFGSWWNQRWSSYATEEPWSITYPYIFRWHQAPLGNDMFYTNMRLNVVGSDMPELNMASHPEFLPYLGSERGGAATVDWYLQYMTHDEIVARFPAQPIVSFDDGWFVRLNGTAALDLQASKAVLGLTDDGFQNLTGWWAANNNSVSTAYRNWLLQEGNQRLDIWSMYEYPLTFIDFDFWVTKEDDKVVIHYDYVTWGMEALMTRWLHEAFLPTEWFFEDFRMHADIGPSYADLQIDTAVAYAAYAWENRTTGDPCWVWEAMLQDYVISYPPIHPMSDFDAYAGRQLVNRGPGNSYHESYINYDYTPGAWNLSMGESLTFQWPSGEVRYIRHVAPGVTANETGYMSVGYSEPWMSDLPTKVLMNLGSNSLTFMGPLDMWTWSRNQTARQNLSDEWDRLGLPPYGIPWIEFQNVSRTGPFASFDVTPPLANTSVTLTFDASSSSDPSNASSSLHFRWDFDSDGTWDTSWSNLPLAAHRYPEPGDYIAILQVRNLLNESSSTGRFVRVLNIPPVARFNCSPETGKAGTDFVFNAGLSSDAEDFPWLLEVRWSWDAGGEWTDWTTYKLANHTYVDVGNHTVTLQVRDSHGTVSFATAVVIVHDSDGPVTSMHVVGTAGKAGWYVTNVTFLFTAEDAGSYVAGTYYRVGGGNWIAFNWTPYTVSDGTSIVEYYSSDSYGNNETVKSTAIKVDRSAPSLVVENEDLYDSSTVVITWVVSESLSGLDRIETSIDGGAFVSQGKETHQTFVNLTDGSHALVVRALDVAGNVRGVTVTFSVDIPAGASTLTYALVGVAAVAAVAAVLLLLMRRRSKGTPPKP